MKVEFVNLKQAGLTPERAAALLAARHHAGGARVLVSAPDPAQAVEVDRLLWTLDPASFVPHARAGADDQDQEPVLIAPGPENLNQAAVLVMLAPPPELPLAAYQRLVLLVPAQEGPELARCREFYRQMQQRPGVELLHTTQVR
ncbi:MAG: DNA polymerase III subunit chi [Desulfarculus sp.]|nr:DNA polymerase III subunit chi [Desulfarculus sp.]